MVKMVMPRGLRGNHGPGRVTSTYRSVADSAWCAGLPLVWKPGIVSGWKICGGKPGEIAQVECQCLGHLLLVLLVTRGTLVECDVIHIVFSDRRKEWILSSKQWHSYCLNTCHVTSGATWLWSMLVNSWHLILLLMSEKVRKYGRILCCLESNP